MIGLPPVREPVRPRHRRHWLRDLLLLPVALLLILVEDVVWSGARRALRAFAHLPPVEATSRALTHLPGWAALPLFVVPEACGRVGEFWAGALLYRGHVFAAVGLYVLVRVVATLVVVFIWQACAPALMSLAWFARVVGWVTRARDWARARVAPARELARRLTRHRGVGLFHRAGAMRRWIRHRLQAPPRP